MGKVRKLQYNNTIVEQPWFNNEKLKRWIHDGEIVWEDTEGIIKAFVGGVITDERLSGGGWLSDNSREVYLYYRAPEEGMGVYKSSLIPGGYQFARLIEMAFTNAVLYYFELDGNTLNCYSVKREDLDNPKLEWSEIAPWISMNFYSYTQNKYAQVYEYTAGGAATTGELQWTMTPSFDGTKLYYFLKSGNSIECYSLEKRNIEDEPILEWTFSPEYCYGSSSTWYNYVMNNNELSCFKLDHAENPSISFSDTPDWIVNNITYIPFYGNGHEVVAYEQNYDYYISAPDIGRTTSIKRDVVMVSRTGGCNCFIAYDDDGYALYSATGLEPLIRLDETTETIRDCYPIEIFDKESGNVLPHYIKIIDSIHYEYDKIPYTLQLPIYSIRLMNNSIYGFTEVEVGVERHIKLVKHSIGNNYYEILADFYDEFSEYESIDDPMFGSKEYCTNETNKCSVLFLTAGSALEKVLAVFVNEDDRVYVIEFDNSDRTFLRGGIQLLGNNLRAGQNIYSLPKMN